MLTVYDRGGITLRLSRGELMSSSTATKTWAIAAALRVVAAKIDPEGDVKTKYRPSPRVKPPRRQSPVKNKSNRSDYSTKYMREYREDGKDYQKMPENLKKLRREQKKRLDSL
jgi:hypothetical protein